MVPFNAAVFQNLLTEKAAAFKELLIEKGVTVMCAESITAGLLASTIASVPGASAILKGSIVTYNRELKTSILGVDPRIIDDKTAESLDTTTAMAYGLTKIYPSAGLYVAVTGVASTPEPGYQVDKEVGQIYVAIYYKKKMQTKDTIIKVADSNKSRGELREEIRVKTVEFILNEIMTIVS